MYLYFPIQNASFLFCEQTLAPAIDWLGCLQTTFHPHPVSQSDHVLLHNLPYIVHMSRIIGKWLNKHELSGRYFISIKNIMQKTVTNITRFLITQATSVTYSMVYSNQYTFVWCLSIFLFSGPLHTFMVLSLLHTVIPALDSRFTQTERNFSLALGTTEEVTDYGLHFPACSCS